MASLHPQSERQGWTLADVVRTYWFWGLLLFFVFSGLAANSLFVFAPMLMGHLGLSFAQMRIPFSMRLFVLPLAFCLAWIAVRGRTLPILIAVAGLQVVAGTLLGVLWPAQSAVAGLSAKFACIYLADGVIQLVAPTLIAGAIGGGGAFLVAFGVMFVLREFLPWLNPMLCGAVQSHIQPIALIAAEALLGLICLTPVNGKFFSQPSRMSASAKTAPRD